MKFVSFLCFLFILISCREGNRKEKAVSDSISVKKQTLSKWDSLFIKTGLVSIQQLDSSIQQDLKYSTNDNLMKYDVYGDLDKVYLQKDAAEILVKAQKILKSIDSNLSIVIYDAARPLSIQKIMWDTLQMTYSEKIKYVSNPKDGGLHNYGLAVDVSILDKNGKALDMGTPFDFLGELASPMHESKYLQTGELKEFQIENRKLLRKVMTEAGFSGIKYEWWHFNACTKARAKEKYKIIE